MAKKVFHKIISKKQHAIIVDGYCEYWYFAMMTRNEKKLNATLKPKLPQRKKLSDQFKEVKESSKHFDKVFWIVDFDKLIEEDRARPKGAKSPIQEFKEYKAKLDKIKNVKVIINGPCLEFWFLLHFESTGRYYDKCEDASKRLLKHLPDYDKSQEYFTKKNHDIYLKLKGKQQDAINNSKALGNFDIDNPASAISEMFNFFDGEDKIID